jgi:hypothetical protein
MAVGISDGNPCSKLERKVMKRILAVAVVAATCLALPAHAATDAECRDMWSKADVNKDGVLTDAESMRYAAAMRVADKKLGADGKLDQASFMEACKSDVYTLRKNDDGAPLKGANSFTEGQAKDRALSRGMTSVGELKKDADGIWRGPAMQDGKSVQVAVDYKGNVVPQAAQ